MLSRRLIQIIALVMVAGAAIVASQLPAAACPLNPRIWTVGC